MRSRAVGAIVVVLLLVAGPAVATSKGPAGLVAASVGEEVVVIEPNSGHLGLFSTGPVGWLYPAPGGVLFAPDLVNASTTVIDLRRMVVAQRLDGITMPVFGPFRDRYMVVTAEQLLMVTYPERASLLRVPLQLRHPWQVEPMVDGSSVLILDRLPGGDGGAKLVAVDLINRKQVYSSPLVGTVTCMEWLPQLGVAALGDVAERAVRMVDPASRLQVLGVHVDGVPESLVAAGDGRRLVVAVRQDDGGGSLRLLDLRSGSGGLRVKGEERMPLPAAPGQLAADPTGRWLAVSIDGPAVVIVDAKKRELLREIKLIGEPRHVVWCDPSTEGPPLPRWSDGAGDGLEFQ